MLPKHDPATKPLDNGQYIYQGLTTGVFKTPFVNITKLDRSHSSDGSFWFPFYRFSFNVPLIYVTQ